MSLLYLALLISSSAGAQLLTGYSLASKNLVGPTQSAVSTDPIWVSDYHTLVIDYTATGRIKPGIAVISLRPGSVGPITPHATNPENPLVSGSDIIAISGSDLVFDEKPHTLRVDLKDKFKAPQIDLLRFVVPEGAKLNIAKLEFVGDSNLLPCSATTTVELPAESVALGVHGPLSCEGAPATSLRGRESLIISASGRQGATIYLDLMAHYAGLSNYIPAPPRPHTATAGKFSRDSASSGIAEGSDPSSVIAHIRYADDPASDEQQFPLLVSEHRHALLNLTRSLYALQIDPKRRLLSVELADSSPHVQLVLFKAAISAREEESDDEPALAEAPLAMDSHCTAESTLTGSQWFSLRGGETPTVHAELANSAVPNGLNLALTLTNNGDVDQNITVSFPALSIHVAGDADDVSYLFPGRAANISSRDASLSAAYGPDFLLQFTDIFAPKASCGAAIIVQDREGRSKTFTLAKQNNVVSDETEYHIRIAAHQTYSLPKVSVVLHNGDWHSGFKAYQRWLASWYQPHTPSPTWLQRTFYMRRDYPLGGSDLLFDESHNRYTFDRLIKEGESFGGIDFIDISGWALSDTHGRVGDYPIELGGVQDLRANVQKAKAEHIPTGLYFEGYLIDKNSDVGRAHGAEWQLTGKDGKGLWWPHGSPEMFICPWVKDWQTFLSGRIAQVANQTGAQAVYLDEFNCGSRQCYATNHQHPPGANMIEGQIQMAQQVRIALDKAGLRSTIVYTECTPVDISAPYVDGTFTYALPSSTPSAYNVKLNLWRFAFPKIRVWDMLSSGVEPHILSAEDFRFAFWHGDGIWLKGRADTWYGEDILAFLRWAHPLLLKHASAFAGEADPLISSSDPHILINRFRGGGETVYTLLNDTYQTRRFNFHGKGLIFSPRGVQLIAESDQ